MDGKKVAMYAKWQSAKAYQAMRESSASHSYLEQALAIAKFQSDIYEIVETFTLHAKAGDLRKCASRVKGRENQQPW